MIFQLTIVHLKKEDMRNTNQYLKNKNKAK